MSDIVKKVITEPPTASELYGLQLHEIIKFPNNHIFEAVMRVPGGWVYSVNCRSNLFVPYHNEYQEK